MNNFPILHLAPMCNITNQATRQVAKDFDCDITWSEMVSSEGLVRQDLKNNKSLALAKKFNKTEMPYWVQIFGNDPSNMAQAAKIIEEHIKPTGIDINLGCPVPKAKKGGYGAVQINNIPEVVKIIKTIKQEISLPLSLKTRLGLTDPTEILKFGPQLAKAGIDQLVIHARTLKGLFSEKPNWEIVKKLNDVLDIPVVYNGGIKTPEDAKFYMEKTGCNNLMIGQAAIGNPWIFQEIKASKAGLLKHAKQTKGEVFEVVPLDESERGEVWPLKTLTGNKQAIQKEAYLKKNTILEHAELTVKYYGSEKRLVGFRTQLSAYMKTLNAPKKIRKQATQMTSIPELKKFTGQSLILLYNE